MSDTIYLHIHSRDTGTSQLLSFNHSPVSVGRNLCNDVVLSSPYVSHLHGILQFSATHIDYVDLGSANGSLICGQKIVPREVQEILPSSELRLGPVSIRIARELKAGEILTTTQVAHLHSFERELDEALSPSPSKREPTQVWSSEPQKSEPDSSLTTVWHRPTQASTTPTAKPEPAPDIDQIVEKLQPLYCDYVSACENLLESLRASAKLTSRHQRNQLFEKLQIQYPEILREPAIRDCLRTETPSHETAASKALHWLARELSGQFQAPTSAKDISSFVTRLVAVAQAQARALVGLHSGALEFAREHAHLVPFDANDPLANPESPKKVLHFLYDWRTPTAPKLRALNQAYKVLMAHQLGLIGGLRGSVRSLLKHLGPAAIEANLKKTTIRFGRISIPWKFWPLRVHARWTLFCQRLARLLEGDELDRALLGKYFASAYTLVCGRIYHQPKPTAFLPVCTEDLQKPRVAPNPSTATQGTGTDVELDEETQTVTRERPRRKSPKQEPNATNSPPLQVTQQSLEPRSCNRLTEHANGDSRSNLVRAALVLLLLVCSCTHTLPPLHRVPLCQQAFGKWLAQNPASLTRDAWKQILLAPPQTSAQSGMHAIHSRYVDCTGAKFSWPTPIYSCGFSSPGISYPATEPEREPTTFWPSPEANKGLAWLHLAQLPDGDALGPVALVESTEFYIQVHAMGTLRGAQYPTRVEFHRVGEKDAFVVFSTRCTHEQTQDTCREEIQLLIRDGSELFTPNLILEGSQSQSQSQDECKRPAMFTRHVQLTTAEGLTVALERALSFDPPGSVTIEEQLSIHHPAKPYGPAQTIRQRSPLTLVDQHLIGARHSLLAEFMESDRPLTSGPQNEF